MRLQFKNMSILLRYFGAEITDSNLTKPNQINPNLS